MVKISQLEIENVKRVKAFSYAPAENGLTVIGGGNNQGKTSVLNSIAWALGGERYRPSAPERQGSAVAPFVEVTLSNGLVVTRTGRNSSLTVRDPSGRKAGQQLLNEFVEQLAIDLPRFMASSNREKADTLLKLIGVGDRLRELEKQERDLYNERLTIGRLAEQKKGHASELPEYSDAPSESITVTELIRRQQDILARNGEIRRKFERLDKLEYDAERLRRELEAARARYEQAASELEEVRAAASGLAEESTEQLERDIERIEMINLKVKANMDKAAAQDDAEEYASKYSALTEQLTSLRDEKRALLDGAPLPLPGLSVEDDELTYNGYKWDGMSGSEQLKVSAAIVRALNPKCGFVLMDKLEQMDAATLREFGAWLESEGLQVIATRVSTGGECQIIVEDGCSVEPQVPAAPPRWTKGVF